MIEFWNVILFLYLLIVMFFFKNFVMFLKYSELHALQLKHQRSLSYDWEHDSIFSCRGTIWLNTLGSSYLVLHSPPMAGCNHMVHGASSPQSSMVMWAALRPWLCSGPQWPRAWPHVQWRECLLVQLQSWTGHLSEMISQGKANWCFFTYCILHWVWSTIINQCFWQIWDLLPNCPCYQEGSGGFRSCWN